MHVNAIFSRPVEKHSDNSGIYRGKAIGSAIMSRFPLQPYPESLEHEADVTCRFSDVIVRVKPNSNNNNNNNAPFTDLADAEKVFVAASRPGVEKGYVL